MGHIKEPKGVDFTIKSEPLTEKARNEISDFIRDYKKKSVQKRAKSISKSSQSKILPA
jgi:hypothetical protein